MIEKNDGAKTRKIHELIIEIYQTHNPTYVSSVIPFPIFVSLFMSEAQPYIPSELSDLEKFIATYRGKGDQLYKHIGEKYKARKPFFDLSHKNAVEKTKALPSGAGTYGQPSNGGGPYGQPARGAKNSPVEQRSNSKLVGGSIS